nr:hypothetical protein Itr_chr01CG08120 [Ipomoea trifida]
MNVAPPRYGSGYLKPWFISSEEIQPDVNDRRLNPRQQLRRPSDWQANRHSQKKIENKIETLLPVVGELVVGYRRGGRALVGGYHRGGGALVGSRFVALRRICQRRQLCLESTGLLRKREAD